MPPNILLILNDDHAQWASGCYGNPALRTPTIDHLAVTGARFANAFTPTPVCSPARACLLTGHIASQHGIHDYLSAEADLVKADWLEDEVTLPQLLQRAGFQTALVGKWHLGHDTEVQPGFDHWFALSGDYPIEHGGSHRYSVNGRLESRVGYKTRIITEEAVRWLRAVDRDRPFFLLVGYTATHSPWTGHPSRLVRSYLEVQQTGVPADEVYPFGRQNLESTFTTREDPRRALAEYFAGVSQLDEGVAQLLDELDARRQRNRTLVAYTSDHGLSCGHHGIWGKGNGTLPLNMVEESIRVPLILNYPGTVPEGVDVEQPVDHLDLFRALADYAAVDLPLDVRGYPGRSLRALAEGTPPDDWREVQFCEYGDVRMIRTPRYKLVLRSPDGPHELFDLQEDPRECTNVFLEPRSRALVAQLTDQLDEYFRTFEDPAKSGLKVRDLPRHNATEAWRSDPAGPVGGRWGPD